MLADSLRLRILLPSLAGWVSRHQQDSIESLIEENHVLEMQLRGRRLHLTEEQRRKLGNDLGHGSSRADASVAVPA